METIIDVPQGQFDLARYPHRDGSPLRAWDAADEYVLDHVADHAIDGAQCLVVNDSFGALAIALAATGKAVQSWCDSHLAHTGAYFNALNNDVHGVMENLVPSTEVPEGPIDVAIIKVPRTKALLEHQLRTLRPHLAPSAKVLGAGMTKLVHTSTMELFGSTIGTTTSSLARKKARLIFAEVDTDSAAVDASPYPTAFETESGLVLTNHANVFSRERLDIGTRLLLDNLPEADAGAVVIDLGCGNGVVGAAMVRANPGIEMVFTDESYMAVASAEATFVANCPGEDASFEVADGLDGFEPGSADVIICNPPFHEGNATGDAVAWQLFTQSRDALQKGGELIVIGNRHLGYHAKLKRLFHNCETVASTTKFSVLRSVR